MEIHANSHHQSHCCKYFTGRKSFCGNKFCSVSAVNAGGYGNDEEQHRKSWHVNITMDMVQHTVTCEKSNL